jgi:hypothetical protein
VLCTILKTSIVSVAVQAVTVNEFCSFKTVPASVIAHQALFIVFTLEIKKLL